MNLIFSQVCREITAVGLLITAELLSNKPEAVISRTNLAKSPDYSYYNILGQLCKHVLNQFVKGITEY